MIVDAQVKLGEEGSAVKFVEELIHHGDQKLVIHCLKVQGVVIYAKSP
jgi:hypothetical protein